MATASYQPAQHGPVLAGRTAIYYRRDAWLSLGSCGSQEAARLLMHEMMARGSLSGDWCTGPVGCPPQQPKLR